MDAQRITVEVAPDGRVRARRSADDAATGWEKTGWSEFGLDVELVGLFERWLTEAERTWTVHEIRTFGQLLHRCLFPDRVWEFVETAIDRAGGDTVRLSLSFPAEPPFSRLAAVPWEYLHTPVLDTRRGYFVARRTGLVLSRQLLSERGLGTIATASPARLLVVVSQPNDPKLGEVDAEPVLDVIRRLDGHGYEVTVCRNPTVPAFEDALERDEPDLVHFMGHGVYSPERREGSIAFARADADGGTDWVADTRLADVMEQVRTPRVVVLHACEGARTDDNATFAGVAPQLVRGGVQGVVAMQYPVTNDTAIRFSTEFYRQMLDGVPLDVAVQKCRWRISGSEEDPDPRLLGVPVVYWQSRDAVLGPGATGGGRR